LTTSKKLNMITTLSNDDKIQSLNPVEADGVDTTDLMSELPNQAQEPSDQASHANQEVTSEEDNSDAGEPNESDSDPEAEDQATETEAEKELKEKREKGKISQLERERNDYATALDITGAASKARTTEEALEAYTPLIADPAKYERLRPYLAKTWSAFADYSHAEFVQKIEESLKGEPANYESLRKVDQARQQTEYNNQLGKLEAMTNIALALPEFAAQIRSDRTQANEDFDDAIEYAKIQAKKLSKAGTDYDPEDLVIQALQHFNPHWTQKNLTQSKAKTATQTALKDTLKGSSTSTPSKSDNTDIVSKMPPWYQKAYQSDLQKLMSKGLTKEQAHIKVLQDLEKL
jgi:hypothetical protein